MVRTSAFFASRAARPPRGSSGEDNTRPRFLVRSSAVAHTSPPPPLPMATARERER
ncbi:unnamed protein product [Spirodela intermedia]|uniref:Uncharacterized protein n=1 Tax=Spirodela intermedia TaxID=51605 RepID=A0A7I8IH88_SPIIN|nr:unnamed protein product [Spirodela intermedia]CAA6657245.1 unnamed protein product [Spirodela intermedia]